MEASNLNNGFHRANHLSMGKGPFKILRVQVSLDTVASRFTALYDLPADHHRLFVQGRTAGEVFLVEGYVETLAAPALGMVSIPSGGTGISAEQLAELSKLPDPVYIVQGNDEEGKQASQSRRHLDD